MSDYRAYVGLDVHKDTIAVAIDRPGRADPPRVRHDRQPSLGSVAVDCTSCAEG